MILWPPDYKYMGTSYFAFGISQQNLHLAIPVTCSQEHVRKHALEHGLAASPAVDYRLGSEVLGTGALSACCHGPY